MRFWDSSALLPLLLTEPASAATMKLLEKDRGIVVWWASRVECVSALRSRERAGGLEAPGVQRALGLLNTLSESWAEVLPTEGVRSLAERALAVHPLRAAGSLQLAAALAWQEGEPGGAEFVAFDLRLRDAAAREGFATLPASL